MRGVQESGVRVRIRLTCALFAPRNAPRLATVVTLSLVLASSPVTARAQSLPADMCSLLPVNQVSKVLARVYVPHARSQAPRVFPTTASGTECEYRAEEGVPLKVLFTVYVEASPATARDVFTKIRALWDRGSYPTSTVDGVGDVAYSRGAVTGGGFEISVLKGRVHYSIAVDQTTTLQQMKDLANWVARQV